MNITDKYIQETKSPCTSFKTIERGIPMYEDYELTEEHFKIAEKNGLSKQLVRNRFNTGWEIDRAITQPRRQPSHARKLVDKAAENGIEITIHAAISRIKLGWDEQKVINTPVGVERRRSVDHLYMQKAAKNGIGVHAFRGRRYRGWSLEDAATKPVDIRCWKKDYKGKRLS